MHDAFQKYVNYCRFKNQIIAEKSVQQLNTIYSFIYYSKIPSKPKRQHANIIDTGAVQKAISVISRTKPFENTQISVRLYKGDIG